MEVDGIEPTGLPIEFGELVTDLIGGGVRGSVLARITELQQPTRRLSANVDRLSTNGPVSSDSVRPSRLKQRRASWATISKSSDSNSIQVRTM